MTLKASDPAARFWSHVRVGNATECWPWTAALRRGYGSFKVPAGAFGVTRRRDVYAHRVAFHLANGRWPEPLGRHTCDYPPCCKPAHIVEGTHAQNMWDKCQRGRAVNPAGEHAHRAKLTSSEVELMRRMYQTGSVTQAELASRFSVSQTSVSRIMTGKRWKEQ